MVKGEPLQSGSDLWSTLMPFSFEFSRFSSTKANGFNEYGVKDKHGLIENEMVSRVVCLLRIKP